MFASAELNHRLDKKIYKNKLPDLRTQLLTLQRQLSEQDFSVIILIAGVDGSGKGDVLNLLNEWLDPRFMRTNAYDDPSDEERERPEFWRFWRDLPPKGRIGIFVSSWYSAPLSKVMNDQIDDGDFSQQLEQINRFEQQQTANGVVIIKFWLHLSKAVQRQRIKDQQNKSQSSWRVTLRDINHLKFYDKFIDAAKNVIQSTDTSDAPWLIVEATDQRYCALTIGEHILERINLHIEYTDAAGRIKTQKTNIQTETGLASGQNNILAELDLGKRLNESSYRSQLEFYQNKIFQLTRKAKAQKRSSILVFEGWDAAGKGGAIRRLAHAIDARNYNIIPVAAPNDEERRHHYLWRFWRHLPRAGKITMFDRSWYGRVLVERVEQLTKVQDWQRAYREIAEFETSLLDHGILLMKFWLHIDKNEQLRRFEEREQISYKQHKITAEDYRNREKWDAYEQAVNEMIARTSTATAPWQLIEANDKRYARIKILKTYSEGLERLLAQR